MTFEQFENQQYLNMETFRKDGQGLKTPVWFVLDEGRLRVWTQAGSGKAKRIRNDSTVRVAPATASGEPVDAWVTARAHADESPEAVTTIKKLMGKKYGILFSVFGFIGRLRLRGGTKYTAIEIQ